MPSIFDLLSKIRDAPGMYLGALDQGDPLERLLCVLVGYAAALETHGIVEQPDNFIRGLSDFVREKTGWPTANLGPLAAIAERTENVEEALTMFWDFADQYQEALDASG